MALLACFQLLLARYCGVADVAVGTPMANRTHTASEHLVGTLVNTLVMRTDLSGNPSFADLLQRVFVKPHYKPSHTRICLSRRLSNALAICRVPTASHRWSRCCSTC